MEESTAASEFGHCACPSVARPPSMRQICMWEGSRASERKNQRRWSCTVVGGNTATQTLAKVRSLGRRRRIWPEWREERDKGSKVWCCMLMKNTETCWNRSCLCWWRQQGFMEPGEERTKDRGECEGWSRVSHSTWFSGLLGMFFLWRASRW